MWDFPKIGREDLRRRWRGQRRWRGLERRVVRGRYGSRKKRGRRDRQRGGKRIRLRSVDGDRGLARRGVGWYVVGVSQIGMIALRL
jgi:hypothetical protein